MLNGPAVGSSYALLLNLRQSVKYQEVAYIVCKLHEATQRMQLMISALS